MDVSLIFVIHNYYIDNMTYIFMLFLIKYIIDDIIIY